MRHVAGLVAIYNTGDFKSFLRFLDFEESLGNPRVVESVELERKCAVRELRKRYKLDERPEDELRIFLGTVRL